MAIKSDLEDMGDVVLTPPPSLEDKAAAALLHADLSKHIAVYG